MNLDKIRNANECSVKAFGTKHLRMVDCNRNM
jgi:hypothetical protein